MQSKTFNQNELHQEKILLKLEKYRKEKISKGNHILNIEFHLLKKQEGKRMIQEELYIVKTPGT